jgi:arginyl-tRNA--protein-N-Asp/Glu arginylyltransferase
MYGRVDLQATNYSLYDDAALILKPDKDLLRRIYAQYCKHKKFKSVEPLFDFDIDYSDTIGYYEHNSLIAFTLVQRLDAESVRGIQFAWDYSNPKLRLGWIANYHECAYYKALGYRYYYLGEHDSYKSKIDGYETLGVL